MSGLTDLECELTLGEQRIRQAVFQSEITDQISTVTTIDFSIRKHASRLSLVIDGPPEAKSLIDRIRKVIDGESL